MQPKPHHVIQCSFAWHCPPCIYILQKSWREDWSSQDWVKESTNLLRVHSLRLCHSYYYHSPICWSFLHTHSLKSWPLDLSFFSTLCLDIILDNFNVHESDILSLYILNHFNLYNRPLRLTWAPHGHGQPWDLPTLQITLYQKSSTPWIWTFWPLGLSQPHSPSYHVLQKAPWILFPLEVIQSAGLIFLFMLGLMPNTSCMSILSLSTNMAKSQSWIYSTICLMLPYTWLGNIA